MPEKAETVRTMRKRRPSTHPEQFSFFFFVKFADPRFFVTVHPTAPDGHPSSSMPSSSDRGDTVLQMQYETMTVIQDRDHDTVLNMQYETMTVFDSVPSARRSSEAPDPRISGELASMLIEEENSENKIRYFFRDRDRPRPSQAIVLYSP